MTTNEVAPKMTVFRFKFHVSVLDVLKEFAKTHEHDDRASYKEAWNLWCDENQDVIRMETTRLCDLGYNGDVTYKMYKAGRYYFRTKEMEVVPPKARRKYIKLGATLIASINAHISGNIGAVDFTPARGFELYDKRESEAIKAEIGRLVDDGWLVEVSRKDLVDKIKKTYKNRYNYLIRKAAKNK